jgi:hypothetical protein
LDKENTWKIQNAFDGIFKRLEMGARLEIAEENIGERQNHQEFVADTRS